MKNELPDFDEVKSMRNIDFGNIPKICEAFVYLYTNIITGQMYLGYHLIKEFGKNYFHSSTSKEFIEIFTGSDKILDYKILHYGNKKEMKSKEYQMLSAVNAGSKNNKEYYNKSNGSPSYHIPDLTKCDNWVDRLLNSDEFPETRELLSDLKGTINWVQVRAANNKSR